MSFDISFMDDDSETIQLKEKHDHKGGTYALGGTEFACLNVTYNYSTHFYKVIQGGIRTFNQERAETIKPILEKAIEQMSDETANDDYWDGTEGNARKALMNLLALAELVLAEAPDAIVEVS